MNTPTHRNQARREQAPDGSWVCILARSSSASQCLASLPAGATSRAVKHRTVDEIWYTLSGTGEFFCERLNNEQPFEVLPGLSFAVPVGAVFQFRNTGSADLEFLITTSPAWPGEAEGIVTTAGPWSPQI